METAWKVNLKTELTTGIFVDKVKRISSQIMLASLICGRNVILIPTIYKDILDVSEFDETYLIQFDDVIENIYVYHEDYLKYKYFHQKSNNEVVGAGFTLGELLGGQELVEPYRLCGEIILKN